MPAAQGAADDGELMTSYYRDDITGLPEMGVVAQKLWSESGLTPGDIQTAFLYDHFTPFVLIQLEELGAVFVPELEKVAENEQLHRRGLSFLSQTLEELPELQRPRRVLAVEVQV